MRIVFKRTFDLYCTQRGKLEGEKDLLSREISTLAANIEQRDIAAAEYHQTQDELRGQLDLAKKLLGQEKSKLVAANENITKLQQNLKGKDVEINKLKESWGNEKAEISQVKTQLQHVLNDKIFLQQELQSTKTKLGEIEGFMTKLHGDDEEVW